MNKFFNQEWNVLDKKLIVSTALLLGIIIGFVFAPIKKGVYCGNHNGNTQLSKAKD
ncbi:MAG: hypothetical protein K0R23_822 [Lacrimispora sp.]|jgi:uncharacterized membrane-anchored protein YhcB (DUF1043 family)|nr:hypothetical protein [Lacrimispora sp.]